MPNVPRVPRGNAGNMRSACSKIPRFGGEIPSVYDDLGRKCADASEGFQEVGVRNTRSDMQVAQLCQAPPTKLDGRFAIGRSLSTICSQWGSTCQVYKPVATDSPAVAAAPFSNRRRVIFIGRFQRGGVWESMELIARPPFATQRIGKGSIMLTVGWHCLTLGEGWGEFRIDVTPFENSGRPPAAQCGTYRGLKSCTRRGAFGFLSGHPSSTGCLCQRRRLPLSFPCRL